RAVQPMPSRLKPKPKTLFVSDSEPLVWYCGGGAPKVCRCIAVHMNERKHLAPIPRAAFMIASGIVAQVQVHYIQRHGMINHCQFASRQTEMHVCLTHTPCPDRLTGTTFCIAKHCTVEMHHYLANLCKAALARKPQSGYW